MKRKQEQVQHKTTKDQTTRDEQQRHGDEAAPGDHRDEAAVQAEKKHKHSSHIRKSGRHSRDNFGSYRGY
ncbi:hypothetical protein SAMN05444008_112140 [Cnuella takakiae]|uniref:Uncharacterized protein n=1 Tax=Cnuella takakiae TaxID=1302690 RepID=A0A1M5EQ09_9BACT|nr:hypothetical protein [Cnuella takakiae]OLY91260.1 hypothetical protein BUE76_04600 [Cnuella takakiae]SHF81393.1 hypothetical protein SAMN05444008_112140 [Cnuella takakiae]